MNFNPKDILSKLPKREYWYSQEVMEAFGVKRLYSIQRARQKHSLGKKMKTQRGATGVFIYEEKDVIALCSILQGKGNPGRRKKS